MKENEIVSRVNFEELTEKYLFPFDKQLEDNFPPMTFMELMGGNVAKNSQKNGGKFYNTCALKLSKALNDAGHTLPFVDGKTISYRGSGENKGKKQWAFYRIKDLEWYFEKTWGQPKKLNEKNYQQYIGQKGIGIVKFNNIAARDAAGHATIVEIEDELSVESYRPKQKDKLLFWQLPTCDMQPQCREKQLQELKNTYQESIPEDTNANEALRDYFRNPIPMTEVHNNFSNSWSFSDLFFDTAMAADNTIKNNMRTEYKEDKEEKNSISEYTGEIGNALSRSTQKLWAAVSHPIDNVVMPLATLASDLAILEADRAPIAIDPDQAFIKECIQENPQLKEDASNRINAIGEHFNKTYENFVNGSGPTRAGMGAEFLFDVFLPGTVGKTTIAAAKTAVTASNNLQKYGVPRLPKFHNLKSNDIALPPVQPPFIPPEKIRYLCGEHKLYWVIDEQSKLLFSRTEYAHEVLTQEGKLKKIVNHPELAADPVFSAGELLVEDGEVININILAGHFLPDGRHQKNFLKEKFIAVGINEAKKENIFTQGFSVGKAKDLAKRSYDPLFPNALLDAKTGIALLPTIDTQADHLDHLLRSNINSGNNTINPDIYINNEPINFYTQENPFFPTAEALAIKEILTNNLSVDANIKLEAFTQQFIHNLSKDVRDASPEIRPLHPLYREQLHQLQKEHHLSPEDTRLFGLLANLPVLEKNIQPPGAIQNPLSSEELRANLKNIGVSAGEDGIKTIFRKTQNEYFAPENAIKINTAEKMKAASIHISKVGNLCGQVVGIFNKAAGQKISTFANSVSGIMAGVSALKAMSAAASVATAAGTTAAAAGAATAATGFIAAAGPIGMVIGGLMGLGSLFFNDDDDDEAAEAMARNFQTVLDTIQKNSQVILDNMQKIHEVTMGRFDTLDTKIEETKILITENMLILQQQNQILEAHMVALSEQINQVESNLVIILDSMLTQLTDNLNIINTNLTNGLINITENLEKGFTHLDKTATGHYLQLMAQLNRQTLKAEQHHQALFNHQHKLQAANQLLFSKHCQLNHQLKNFEENQKETQQHTVIEKFTHTARQVLHHKKIAKNSLASIVNKLFDGLRMASSDLLREAEILTANNGFNSVNLLQSSIQPEKSSNLINLTVWQTNLNALFKLLKNQQLSENDKMTIMTDIKETVEPPFYELLKFIYSLSDENSLFTLFTKIEALVVKQQDLFATHFIAAASHFVSQQKIHWQEQLMEAEIDRQMTPQENISLNEKMREAILARQNSILESEIDLTTGKISQYIPRQYRLSLENNIDLPLLCLPPIPDEIAWLELLNEANIQCQGVLNGSQLRVIMSIKFDNHDIILAENTIMLDTDHLFESWCAVQTPFGNLFALSAENENIITQKYQATISAHNQTILRHLLQDINFLESVEQITITTQEILNVVYTAFSLLFVDFEKNPLHPLTHYWQTAIQGSQWLLQAMEWNGEGPVPGLNPEDETISQMKAANKALCESITTQQWSVANPLLTELETQLTEFNLATTTPQHYFEYLETIHFPKAARAHCHLIVAKRYIKNDEYQLALMHYLEAIVIAPYEISLHLECAKLFLALDNPEKAIWQYTLLQQKLHYENPHINQPEKTALLITALKNRGKLNLVTGNAYAALEDYLAVKAMLYSEIDKDIEYGIARSLELSRSFNEAILFYQQLINLATEKPFIALCLEGIARCYQGFQALLPARNYQKKLLRQAFSREGKLKRPDHLSKGQLENLPRIILDYAKLSVRNAEPYLLYLAKHPDINSESFIAAQDLLELVRDLQQNGKIIEILIILNNTTHTFSLEQQAKIIEIRRIISAPNKSKLFQPMTETREMCNQAWDTLWQSNHEACTL